ncbi:MAG: AMP-binding protein [Bacteroidia bacterium]|nr:AMP-binding protein [Bacteroidia bacterium]
MKQLDKKVHPLLEQLTELVWLYPQREAVIDKSGVSYTYGELWRMVSGAQAELKSRNIKKGSRVLVAIPMSVHLYALLLALFSLGAIAVFLDPWMKGKKMGEVIGDTKPDLMLISPRLRFLAYLIPGTRKIPDWWTVKEIPTSNLQLNFTGVNDEDTALITFTSGTSGKPKGADRTFGFLSAQINALRDHLQRPTPQRDFTNFPIVGLANLGVGNTVIVPRINLMKIHKASSRSLKSNLKDTKASRLIVSPSLLTRVLASPNAMDEVEEVFTGGAPIPFSLLQSCMSQYPELQVEAIFGSTEAEPVALTTFSEMQKKMEDPLKGVYAGIPEKITQCKLLRGTEAPIDTCYFKNNECGPGEIGELLVSGQHVNKSYFENPEAFKKNKVVDENGQIWHRMGDMGYFDNQGALFLVGRLHRVINHNGKEYHPFPFEFFLERKLGLRDIGYIQDKNNKILLFIGKRKVSKASIMEAAKQANYPLDDVIFFKGSLPRDPRHQSKLDVHALLAKRH